MHCTRREMLSRIGADELEEQFLFHRIKPMPDMYWIGAMIASTVARANWSGKGTCPKFEDYLPKWADEKEEPLPDDQSQRNFESFMVLHNAKMERDK
jgi:hypothetical protein